VKILALEGATPSRENVREGRYPLVRDLCLVTRKDPQGKVKAFVAFMLSPEGQGFVAQSFLPVGP
jgi:phosphate transport system substrate-binding protein